MKYVFLFAIKFFLLGNAALIAGKLDLEFYNVGQGNCILAKVTQHKQKPEYMLVDIGTSSFRKEFAYNKLVGPINETLSPSQNLVSFDTPLSIKKKVNPQQALQEEAWGNNPSIKKERGEDENRFIQEIKKKLIIFKEAEKRKQAKTFISLKTVIITHPDTDHYGLLTKLFSEDDDYIEHIILGGLPEDYDKSGKLGFNQWIKKRINNKSKVYFPSIQYAPIKALEDILPNSNRTYAEHSYTLPDQQTQIFEEAFNFGEGIKVSLLSINPTHIVGNGNIILKLSDSEDSNVDSIVLKIENGAASTILTGDAIGVTTQRIINNYFDCPDFLKTNVLLASHHGSATHESNNLSWIQATQPEFVIVSNGLLHGHPHEDAYNNFKKSSRLQRVTKHKVLVSESKNKAWMHETQNAIFSTLTSGTITVQLKESGEIALGLENQKDLKILKKGSKPKDKKVEIILDETAEKIIASPKPKAKGPLRNTQPIIPIPFPRSRLDEESVQLTDNPPELDSPYVGHRSTELSKRKRQEIINPLIFTEAEEDVPFRKKVKIKLPTDKSLIKIKEKKPLLKERKKKKKKVRERYKEDL